MKEKMLNMLEEYIPGSEDIKLEAYGGYSFIHIDILYKGTPALYTTINVLDKNKPLIMKVCNLEESCTESFKDILLMKELENICKLLNIKEIYGRVKILKNKNASKEFYSKVGYKFDFRPKDKTYLSAIVSKEF